MSKASGPNDSDTAQDISQGDCEISILAASAIDVCETRLAELDEIFFSSSNRKTFASAENRAAFRARWLGRYLDDSAADIFYACDQSGSIVGYILSGTAQIVDGAPTEPLRPELGYREDWGDHVARFPAHLHVNLLASHRSCGIGEDLVAHLCAHLRSKGTPGLHLLTSANARNVRFYSKCGFSEQARASDDDASVVFLAQIL